MRGRCRFATKRAAKFEQLFDMERRRGDRPRAVLDHVVETKLQFLMLAKTAEYFGHRPFRIENRQDVANTRVAVSGKLIEAADSDPKREFHRDSWNGCKAAGANRRWI